MQKIIFPETESFVLAGVLQRETLAPYLFVIVVVHPFRKTIPGREADIGLMFSQEEADVFPLNMTDLDFVDDIALMSNRIK